MTDSEATPSTTPATTGEHHDLIDSLRRHRGFLRQTTEGMSDEQARTPSTVSALTLGGLIKHVAATEEEWLRFIVEGPGDTIDWESVDWRDPPAEVVAAQQQHTMTDDEHLGDLLARYDEVAARTDALVATLDLDARQPLPDAPWFAPGTTWSARRVLLHLIAETSQHAGHADIVREAIDGAKTMG